MAESVLLTGASGFVGLPLAQALAARGWTVHAQARRVPGPAIPGVTWHLCDLLDPVAASALLAHIQPTHLVHAAWYVAHGRFWEAPENRFWLEASCTLAAQFFDYGGQRLVGIGSCAEYDWHAANAHLPWPESRLIAPATQYGRAKAMLSQRLCEIAAAHPGAQVAWARLFHLFGPNEPAARLVPGIAQALLLALAAPCSSGRQVRDFASTWWLAEALAALTRSDVTGPVNIAPGQGQTIAWLVQCIARLSGHPELLQLGALPDRRDDIAVMVANTTRLREEVGFDVPADTEADLRRLIALLKLRT